MNPKKGMLCLKSRFLSSGVSWIGAIRNTLRRSKNGVLLRMQELGQDGRLKIANACQTMRTHANACERMRLMPFLYLYLYLYLILYLYL